DFTPYLLKSTNRGRSWKSIRGDLPDRHLVWSIVQDHEKEDLLFLGTEFGIYFTVNGGVNWIKLTGGVPTIAFRDLEIQRRENDLVAASFGRGVYIFDDYSPLRQASDLGSASPANLFPVKDALLYIPRLPLGLRDKANQGGAYYTAPNPPFGAIFTYYLQDDLKTSKEQRLEKEKAIAESGGDVPFPGYDKLQQESREDKPKMVLVVTDESGEVVRRVEGVATAGFHRVHWDLRYPALTPTDIEKKPPANPWERVPIGPLAAPGNYSVALAKVENGTVEMLGEPQSFKIVPLWNHTLTPQDRSEVLAFQRQTGELQRRAIIANEKTEELAKRMPFLKQAILETPGIDAALLERAKTLENRLKDVQKQLAGDPIRSRLWEFSTPSILARISDIVDGHWNNTYGPTKTHRDNYAIAAEEFQSVNAQLQDLIGEIEKLEADMDAAGAPWTPGRDIQGN
ncbi:MAG: glycosyl hydrolase, partial [bacterium]